MRSKDRLVELQCSNKERVWLESALKEVIGASRSVRHHILRIEMKISNMKPSIEVEDVEEAVNSFFDHGQAIDLKVALTNPA